MGRIRHAFAWWCIADRVDPESFFAEAAHMGYEGVELAPPELWDRIRHAGLEISAIQGHQSLEDGMNRRENHDRIEQEILENLRQAKKYGISALICLSGNRHGAADEQGIQVTAEGLCRVAPAAEDAGVNLVLELLNSRRDHPGYQCDRTEWGLRVVKRVSSPQVKLLYDIYHMQIMEGDVIQTIRDHHAQFAHYHTAGNPGRHEIDDTQEINYPGVIRAIRETGYSGWLVQEFIPRGDVAGALGDAIRICSL